MIDQFRYCVEETLTARPELHVWVNGGKAGTLQIPREFSNALIRLTAAVDDTGVVTHDGGSIDYIRCTYEVLGGHTHLELSIADHVLGTHVLGTLCLRNEEKDALERIFKACDLVRKVGD